MRCGNVPVKNNENRFLFQKAKYIHPYPFPLVNSSYALKPEKNLIIIYTSENIKPRHRSVGSP